MKLLVLTIVLFFPLISAFSQNMVKDEEWVRSYFNELKKTYDKRVAPMGTEGPGSPVKVYISMWILDIYKVDDSDMDYTVQFYFRQSWNDSRLSFKDRDEVIILRNADDIWSPDLFFTGSREGKMHQIVHPNAMLRIKPSGFVFYSIRITLRIPCSMDLRSFPHDIQTCVMRMESYAHTKKDIEPEWLDGQLAVGYYKDVKLFNFDLIGVNETFQTENLTTGQYKVLHVNFTLQRKFGFYAIKLYVPFILLVIVSLLSLWIKAEERAIRFSLLILILYFMINISSEVSNFIPPAPYTKGTDVWIGFCESLVFAIFLEFIAVALISGRHEKDISESKGEILLNMEAESKEQALKSDSLKSHLCKLVNMFDARNGGKGKRDASAYRIDRIFRLVFPLIFVLFNVVYWSVYCCKSIE